MKTDCLTEQTVQQAESQSDCSKVSYFVDELINPALGSKQLVSGFC